MSYVVHEALEETRARLTDLKVLSEKYPGASLQDLPNGTGVWSSSDAEKDFTHVQFVADKTGQVFACPYVEVGRLRVYGGMHTRFIHAFELDSRAVLDALPSRLRGISDG